MQEAGNELMLNSALAKMHNSLVMRETVALARETCGGNGITLETDVARFFADAEAILHLRRFSRSERIDRWS